VISQSNCTLSCSLITYDSQVKGRVSLTEPKAVAMWSGTYMATMVEARMEVHGTRVRVCFNHDGLPV
jgi:hypothetical protein